MFFPLHNYGAEAMPWSKINSEDCQQSLHVCSLESGGSTLQLPPQEQQSNAISLLWKIATMSTVSVSHMDVNSWHVQPRGTSNLMEDFTANHFAHPFHFHICDKESLKGLVYHHLHVYSKLQANCNTY